MISDKKKQILNRILEMLCKNKKLAMVWIEEEFGNYENYLKELQKIDPIEKALNNKKIYNIVNEELKNIF